MILQTNAVAIRNRTHVRIIVGAEDRLLRLNKEFSDQLTSLGIKHEYETIPGVGHDTGAFYEKLGQVLITSGEHYGSVLN